MSLLQQQVRPRASIAHIFVCNFFMRPSLRLSQVNTKGRSRYSRSLDGKRTTSLTGADSVGTMAIREGDQRAKNHRRARSSSDNRSARVSVASSDLSRSGSATARLCHQRPRSVQAKVVQEVPAAPPGDTGKFGESEGHQDPRLGHRSRWGTRPSVPGESNPLAVSQEVRDL